MNENHFSPQGAPKKEKSQGQQLEEAQTEQQKERVSNNVWMIADAFEVFYWIFYEEKKVQFCESSSFITFEVNRSNK